MEEYLSTSSENEDTLPNPNLSGEDEPFSTVNGVLYYNKLNKSGIYRSTIFIELLISYLECFSFKSTI